MYQISVQTAVCCLEYGNPRGFNALLGMWKEIPAYWYFHIAEILWLSRAFMGGTQKYFWIWFITQKILFLMFPVTNS